nr:MAG TPA: hypothetical protein [Caudoviricetes sp.]
MGRLPYWGSAFCSASRNFRKRTYSITFRISSSVRPCTLSISCCCIAFLTFDAGASTSPRR